MRHVFKATKIGWDEENMSPLQETERSFRRPRSGLYASMMAANRCFSLHREYIT